METIYTNEENTKRLVVGYDDYPCDYNPLDNPEDMGIRFYTRKNHTQTWGTHQMSTEALQQAWNEHEENGDLLLKVYAYVHGGTAFSLSPFHCPWDSGQCGFISIDKDVGKKLIAHKPASFVRSILEEYQEWVNGQIFYMGYDTNRACNSCESDNWEPEDSIGGIMFPGTYTIEQAAKDHFGIDITDWNEEY